MTGKPFRNRITLAMLVFLVAPSFARAAEPARVEQIRHASQQGNTRVVLELSRPTAWKQMALVDPARVVVDIEAVATEGVGAVAIGDGRLHRIRVGQQELSTVRIVFDVDQIVDYRAFELTATDGQPPRLVLDFFGPDAAPGRVAAASRETEPAAVPASGAATNRQLSPAVLPAAGVIPAPLRNRPIMVMVDAGHGGQDPGAHGHGVDEKEICLAIARKIVQEIEKRPGFRARLTRDDDRFIPLRGRFEVAEKAEADAFVSVHCNASKSSSAHGTEVYFLSLSGATDEASRELARLENAADLMGGVAPEADDDLSSILFDMQQADMLQRGSMLAESVMESLRGHSDLTTRGVKQAGFLVLKSPQIPSILVETAFITNAREAALLRSGTFQTGFSRRVADGIVRFFAATALAGLR
ncbi:MAG: N-acetylmuramoyl-L-alanine amidase [Candidatus Eisenbacteria bacterium]|nr:N-acetylmuramoyl-L-alanine amidase [Candidatus Eisenbacteria bacterium]